MVETTITDIVRSAITTDNPLATFNQMIFLYKNLLASIATASLAESYDLRSNLLGNLSIFHIVEPLLEECLKFIRALLALETFVHEASQTLLHLLIGNSHTQAIFAEVLEEGVRPCRTLALLILGIRSRRHGAGVDRRTAGSIGNNLAVTEELGDELHVRRLTATGACTGELKERSSKLRVLHVAADVHQVLLGSHFLYAILPVLCLSEL